MPARLVGSMALPDPMAHGWDLARATGQEFPGTGEAVVAEPVDAVGEPAPAAGRRVWFGEPAPKGEDASAFGRLLARTGRAAHGEQPAGDRRSPGIVEL
ncbi:hypothetical protein [Streptomyces sp. NPDC092370]|uniref:hypothetical protein n=1 Tax=Streptomyces sp. NPDC092370 TaxID=3366016 RepID=UPI00380D69CC